MPHCVFKRMRSCYPFFLTTGQDHHIINEIWNYVTQSRFDRIMDELKRDREARDKKWDAQEKKWKANEKKWDEERRIQDKKWDANQKIINEILASIEASNERFNSTIGALGTWTK